MIYRLKYIIGIVLLAFFISACGSASETNKDLSDDTVETGNQETDDTKMESGTDTQPDNKSDVPFDSESDVRPDSENNAQSDSENGVQLESEGNTNQATDSTGDQTMKVDKESEALQDDKDDGEIGVLISTLLQSWKESRAVRKAIMDGLASAQCTLRQLTTSSLQTGMRMGQSSTGMRTPALFRFLHWMVLRA